MLNRRKLICVPVLYCRRTDLRVEGLQRAKPVVDAREARLSDVSAKPAVRYDRHPHTLERLLYAISDWCSAPVAAPHLAVAEWLRRPSTCIHSHRAYATFGYGYFVCDGSFAGLVAQRVARWPGETSKTGRTCVTSSRIAQPEMPQHDRVVPPVKYRR